MPRLHGFHRFLPHLWELFLWTLAGSIGLRMGRLLGLLLVLE